MDSPEKTHSMEGSFTGIGGRPMILKPVHPPSNREGS